MSFGFEAEFFRSLMNEASVRPRRLLVVGCGAGVEVVSLGQATGASVVGVDLTVDRAWARPGVHLVRADARALPFRAGTFDAVYCYHVLEHVPEPDRAVAETRRALTPDGFGYFGTPNRDRLVGYIGGRATMWEKLRWNAADWGRRLRGRWSNESGAHAGFSRRGLSNLLRQSYPVVESVDLSYYMAKYSRIAGFWRLMFRLGFAAFLAPSVYFRTRCQAGSPHR
jgi:SAM-dependent methyltransferase